MLYSVVQSQRSIALDEFPSERRLVTCCSVPPPL